MTTVTIDDELAARAQAVTPAGQEWGAFVADALRERVERAEREATRWEAARAEMQAALHGPRRPLAESDAEFRLRHDIADLSHLTPEQRADDAERVLAAMTPAAREALEREGWL